MTRPDLTDITFVLDRSGSMESIKSATIESYNGFVDGQRHGAGELRMSLVQFDDRYEPNYTALPIAEVPTLTDQTYSPRASTALLDAMGRAIVATGDRLRNMPEHERPGTVLFVTLTDGLENASSQYSLQRINDMIHEQRDTYAWQFLFLGANQDAIATAARLGIDRGQAMTYGFNSAGIDACMDAVGGHVLSQRARKMACYEDCDAVEFTEADRQAANPEANL